MSESSPPQWLELLGQAVLRLKPADATGVYITRDGITFGKRTNAAKFPSNFVPFKP